MSDFNDLPKNAVIRSSPSQPGIVGHQGKRSHVAASRGRDFNGKLNGVRDSDRDDERT
jgi:hypothetical protein